MVTGEPYPVALRAMALCAVLPRAVFQRVLKCISLVRDERIIHCDAFHP